MTETQIEELQAFQKSILQNVWRNVYWFARMLINTDKYGGIGTETRLLVEITSSLPKVIDDEKQTDEIRVSISKNILKTLIEERFIKAHSRIDRARMFIADVSEKLRTVQDVAVLVLTAEKILIPINEALKEIPNNDKEFTEVIAKAYLDELGDAALATVACFWDDAGVEGCLNAERSAVVREFTNLQRSLTEMPEYECNIVLTAFVQEFERRLGQKRKGRAGGSLEDVATFLFDYYSIKAERGPDHFQADIEVDKWVKCKDKWLIGISCKRTLRERWKQVSSATSEVLSKYKIRQIWHLVTYDEDLSDDKLALLGGLRHIFYLRDDSRKLISAQTHIGLKEYVRPMSKFIEDLRLHM